MGYQGALEATLGNFGNWGRFGTVHPIMAPVNPTEWEHFRTSGSTMGQ